MSGVAWLTSLVICGVVWGGFLFLLNKAIGHEGRKAMPGEVRKPTR